MIGTYGVAVLEGLHDARGIVVRLAYYPNVSVVAVGVQYREGIE